MIDHEDLRAFAEVAKAGTFTAAAKALITTQPSLSRRIARLEEAIGAPLFERDRHHTPKLTTLGHLLLPYASDLVAQAEAFEHVARTYVEGGTEQLTMAIREPLAGPCLPHLVRYLGDRVPDLDIRILELPQDLFGAVPNALLQYRAELGLGSSELIELASFPAIESVTFGLVQHYAVGTSHYLGHENAAIEWDELARFPLLLPVPADQVVYPAAHTVPSIRHESGSSGLLLAMARSGLGVAILAGNHGEDGRLVYRPVEVRGMPQRSEVRLMWRRHGEPSPVAQRIVANVQTRIAHGGLPLFGEHQQREIG